MAVIREFLKYQTYPLLEKFGILNLDDAKYLKDIDDITNLYKKVKRGLSDNYENVNIDWFGEPLNGSYKLIILKNKCNIPIILLLIRNIDDIFGSDAYNYIDNMVLNNEESIKHGYFKYTKYTEKDLRGNLVDRYNIKLCTILILYSNQYKPIFDIDRVMIEHELKHIYDLYKSYLNDITKMNKDVLLLDTEFRNYTMSEGLEHNLPERYAFSIGYELLYHISDNYMLFKNDRFLMLPILSDLLYYMNKSEVSARLTSFIVQEEIKNTKKLYVLYKKLCNNIITYATDSVKQYINNIILKFNYSYIYHLQFKNSKNAYVYNVKLLFNLYIKRCDYFITRCDKLKTLIPKQSSIHIKNMIK